MNKLKVFENTIEFSYLFIFQFKFWSCNLKALDLDPKSDFLLYYNLKLLDFVAEVLHTIANITNSAIPLKMLVHP